MLKPGYSFDRYTIEDVLGEGGMGLVYRAHDARLDRKVALKIVREPAEDPKQRDEAKARLLREARAAAALDHPNAVSIYDVGEVDGMPYIAMELVAGKTVRDALEDASVTTTQRLRVLRDVARALAAAHKAGLVHRDIKPENVMMRGDGRVKVLDFGIARRSAAEDSSAAQAPALATLTAKDVRIGTPTYMAPERIRGEPADGRADQFSWGVLAYELLTGSLPWRGHDAMSLVASILTEAPPPMREGITKIPDGIEEVIRRALAKAPADRYGSMDEVVSAVEALLAGSSASLPPERVSSASGKPGAAALPASASLPPSPSARSPSPSPSPLSPSPLSSSPLSSSPPSPPLDPAAAPDPIALGTAPTDRFTAPSGPKRTTDLRRYSTQELGDIMQRALVLQGARPRFTHEDLVQAAREVGIDEMALRLASRELRGRQRPMLSPAESRVRERQKLLRHMGMYFVFSVFFFLLDRATGGWNWSIYPILGWGVVVAAHAIKYLFPVDPSPRKLVEERRRRGEPTDRAIEEGAELLLSATEERSRIRVPDASGAGAGGRIAIDEGRDAAAEEEAAAEAEEPRSRKKRRRSR